MPRQTIAGAAYELLASRRAATSDELGESIATAGLTRAKSPTQAVSGALNEDGRFRRLADGRWMAPALLLDDAVLTHRPTAQELEHDALNLEPDLAVLMNAGIYGLTTADGSSLRMVWDREAQGAAGPDAFAVIQGPPGWLDGAAEMPLLHVRLRDGTVEAAWGPEPRATARMRGRRIIETIRRSLDRQPRDETIFGLPPAVLLSKALLQMLVDEADLLHEPLLPLGELFEGSGLEAHRDWVGYEGTDWELIDDFWDLDDDGYDGDLANLPELEDDWSYEGGVRASIREDDEDDEDAEIGARLEERFGLSDDNVLALRTILGALELDRMGAGPQDPTLLRDMATVVADPRVAHVLAIMGGHDLDTEGREVDLESFMARLEGSAQGVEAAGPRYVLAACAEARDDVLEAERQLRAALDADPRFGPAAIELARFETDRSRYGEALRLLRDADVPVDDEERSWLEEAAQAAFPKVGRNERCPCGSGRKYKSCHLGREADAALVDPVQALLHKLWLWLDRPAGRRLIYDLVVEVVPDSDRPEKDDAERERLLGPILDDVVLYDRGQLERFLRLHRVLLPEQEHELGSRWLATRRSIYEVVSVRPGRGLTVRDLLTNADASPVQLVDRLLSRQVERLDLLCLRLVPDPTGSLTPSNGMLVPRPQRTRVSEIVRGGDPMELLDWLARPDPLPALVNREGEPLRLVDATYRLPDPAAAVKALDRKLRREDDKHFVELLERDGQDLIRGSITLEGDVARVQANSERRADRLEKLLLRAAPGSRLIHRDVQGMEAAFEDLAEGKTGVLGASAGGVAAATVAVPVDDPAIAAALEQVVRDYEQRWVDESIPALGGMTPRQSMDDPEMRRELEALLDDMAWRADDASTRGTMDPDRIRRRLGLGQRRG